MPSTNRSSLVSQVLAGRRVRSFARVSIVVAAALICCTLAHAQGGVPLVTVATDQSPLQLSDQFGVPAGTAINQAGDFAFVGNGDTALFLRPAGAAAPTRLLQIEDEAPGFPGSQIAAFSPYISLNASRVLFFGVYLRANQSESELQSALLTFDGTNYKTIVKTGDTAPGSVGATFTSNLNPGSIDDSGDIDFAATPSGATAIAYYIVPAGGAPVRIVAANDTPPAACTWCTTTNSLENFFAGQPGSNLVLFEAGSVPPLNSQGQMLLSLWGGLFIGSKDGSLSLVPMAASGPCSPQPASTGTGTLITYPLHGYLNDAGTVAFSNPSSGTFTAICVAPAGGGPPQPAITAGQAAPSIYGGSIISALLDGLNDSGDLVFDSAISGSQVTPEEVLRYHAANGALDIVAYYGEPAPDTNGFGLTFSTNSLAWGGVIRTFLPGVEFSGITMASDGTVSFRALLNNGDFGLYSQSGGGTPGLIFLGPQPTSVLPAGVAIFPGVVLETKILDNGSTLFTTFLTGAGADFAVYLGTPTGIQPLMTTADSLPAGARTILEGPAPKAAGKLVAFTAQPAAGRRNILLADTSSGSITRVVSDNDPALVSAAGITGNTVLGSSFFLNENRQIAFETFGLNSTPAASVGLISFTNASNQAWSGSAGGCATIYLWSPSSGVAKVVTPGDPVPNSNLAFSCVALNATAPSPLNRSGQVAFSTPQPLPPLPCSLCDPFPSSQPDGVYLYTPGTGISEIAAASDTLPGQATPTAFVPDLSVPVNSAGEVAFGAELGTTQGFFLLKPGGTAQSIMSEGGAISNSNMTFGFPHFLSGSTDDGGLAFTAATNTAADGLFYAPPGGIIQTVALDGAPAPGGGTFALTSGGPSIIISTGTTTPIPLLRNFAAINEESDIAFGAPLTGGTADSGYFRLLQNGPAAGTLAPVVLQGQAAPGGGTFNTIPLVSNLGGNFSLGPDGALAFLNTFTDGSLPNRGLFVARPDGTLLRVVAGGDLLPGGGTLGALSLGYRTAAGNAGEFAFLAGILGGSAHEAVFVTAIPAGTAATTTILGSSQASLAYGETLTLTATVSSKASGTTSGTMTGNVSFFDRGVLLGTSSVSSGQAALNLSTLSAGSHSIVAQYSGDSNFAASNSPVLSETITPRTTSIAVASSLNPAVGGQSVTFTATVTTSAGGAPTGTVAFLDSGSAIGNGTLDGNAVATLATTSLSVAGHPITASYGGDANSAASASSALTENVAVAGFAPVSSGLSVSQGQSVSVPLTLYGAPGSSLSFMLSCSGLPAGASCAFAKNPVTAGVPPSGTTMQLTFSTTGLAAMPNRMQRRLLPPASLIGLFALALGVMLAAWTRFFARSQPGTAKLLPACGVGCATFALALLLAGCGATGSSPPSNVNATPTGLASFTVTGTSGATTISTNVQVMVR